jgi:hypothetical protein
MLAAISSATTKTIDSRTGKGICARWGNIIVDATRRLARSASLLTVSVLPVLLLPALLLMAPQPASCAEPVLEQTTTRTTYDFEALQSFSERWHYLVLGLVCAGVVTFVGYMYRRDSVELRPGLGALLLMLRLVALLGVLAYFLQLEKRTERKVIHNSRVILLVDTSLSMGLHDSDSSSVPATPNRLEQVVDVLGAGGLVEKLRETSDVIVARFDADTNRILSLGKLPAAGEKTAVGKKAVLATGAAPLTPDDEQALAAATAATQTREWKQALVPQGSETRLGHAVRSLINEERSAPLAGIVLFSDGGQNAGVDPQSAIDAAREAKVPVFTVGIGSDRRPANVRISDFVAPARAYPGDSFTVTGYLQSAELSGRTVTVELTSKPAGEANKNEQGKVEGTERVTLGNRGDVIPVKFEITPGESGRRTLRIAVKSPPEDTTPADDAQEADVEIVDRKTRVLLFASGPTREYIFLRNQLRRDKEMIVDVYLQTAQPGISQDANEILEEFPSTPQELFEYDCIVGFDPDWLELEPETLELVERWVAEKAGGLIVLAGPVETDRWAQDPKTAKIRALYPVEFNRRLSLVEDGRFGSETPWPLEFSREGLEAEFLWLADSAPASGHAWATFGGVYGYYGVQGAKPGASVYARYSDPESASSGQLPVYMAGHFFGSGRVFYLGSGEMWRLRAVDDSYFEQFYTKLVRHVSQGRLLIGSTRGMLLVDRDRYLSGGTVVVRAQLNNPQFEPLDLPQVDLQVVQPDSTVQTLPLAADPDRKGMYSGQFTAVQEGTYRLELDVPGSEGQELSRRIQVKVPDLERENPQRNDALLSEMAKRTGGLYYVGAAAVLGRQGMPELASQLKDCTQVTYLAGIKDLDFEKRWMWVLMGTICGALFLEWTIRRLAKLA